MRVEVLQKLHITSKFDVPEVSNKRPTNIRCHRAAFSRSEELMSAILASLVLWPSLTLCEVTQAVRLFAHLNPLTRFNFRLHSVLNNMLARWYYNKTDGTYGVFHVLLGTCNSSVAHVSGMRYYATCVLWGLINAPVHSINYRPFEHRIEIRWIQYLIAHCVIHI
jgi:hypothetical protein